MDAQDFIASGTFELSEDITIQPLTQEEAQAMVQTNVDFGDFIAAEGLEALSQTSAISDQSEGPTFPSYQVINEAGRTVAGSLPESSTMGPPVTNAIGVLEPAKDSLDRAAVFADDLSFDFTAETKAELEEAQKLWATGTLALANAFDKAEGGFKFSTSGVWDIGANVVSLNSDGHISFNGPNITSVATNKLDQSRSHITTTNLNQVNAKSQYTNVKGSDTNISGDKMEVTVNQSTKVANNMNVKTVEEHSLSSNVAKINTGEATILNSQQDTVISSENTAQFNSTVVSITASSGSKVPAGTPKDGESLEVATAVRDDGLTDLTVVDALGNTTIFEGVDESAEGLATPKWQSFTAALDGQTENTAPAKDVPNAGLNINSTGNMSSFVDGNTIRSTGGRSADLVEGNFTLASSNGALNALGKAVAVEGETTATLGAQKGSLILYESNVSFCLTGGITCIGQRKPSIAGIPNLNKPPKLKKVPKRPDLPKGITYDDLEKCIPKKFKPNVSIDEPVVDLPDVGNAPRAEDIEEENNHMEPTGATPTDVSEGNLGQGEADSQIEQGEKAEPVDSSVNNPTKIGENTDGSLPDKILGSAGVVEGGPDILPPENRDNESEEGTAIDSGGEEVVGKKDKGDEVAPDLDSSNETPVVRDGNEPLSDEARAIEEEQREIWGNAVIAVLTRENVESILDELSVLPVVRNAIIASLGSDSTEIVDYLGRLSPGGLSPEYEARAQALESRPGGWREFLQELTRQVQAEMGRGGGLVQFATDVYRRVNDGINVVNSTIDDIQDSRVGRITKTAGEYAKYIPGQAGELVGDVAAGLNAILNSDVQAGIDFLTANSSSLSTIYKTLQTVLQNREFGEQVIDLLGSDRLRVVVRDQILARTSIGQRLAPNPENPGELIETDFIESEVSAAVDLFVTAMLGIRDDDEYKEDGFTRASINRVVDNIYGAPSLSGIDQQLIREIINATAVRSAWADVLNANIEDFITGSAFENFLPYVVGQQNAAMFIKVKGIYFRAKDIYSDVLETYDDTREAIGETVDTGRQLYTSLKAIPGMLALMNEYKMPVLSQVKTLLTCLDLLKQFKKLFNDVKDLIDTVSDFADPLKDTINTLEDIFDLLGVNNDEEQPAGGNDEDPTQDLLSLITDGNVTGTVTPIPSLPPSEEPSIVLDIAQDDRGLTDRVDPPARVSRRPNISNILTEDSCGNIIFSASRKDNHDDDPSKWSDTITDDEVIKTIETLPRLTQILNSVREIPTGGPTKDFGGLINEDQINDIKNTRITVETDACYLAPELNLVEATVDVQEIRNGIMLFRMANLDLLKFNGKNILPNKSTIIQIYVEEFVNNKTGQTLKVHRRNQYFSPYVYNFTVSNFKASRNIGIAQYVPQQPRIYLRDVSNTTFSYGVSDIGKKLSPIILDSYVLL